MTPGAEVEVPFKRRHFVLHHRPLSPPACINDIIQSFGSFSGYKMNALKHSSLSVTKTHDLKERSITFDGRRSSSRWVKPVRPFSAFGKIGLGSLSRMDAV
jgi:hypothetical protein